MTLKIAEYLLKGVDGLMGADPDALPAQTALPGRPIDLERYAGRKT